VLIRHLWQLKTAPFLHWCLTRAVLLRNFYSILFYSTGFSLLIWSVSDGEKHFFNFHLVLEQAADERLGSRPEGVGQAVVAVKDVVLRGRPGS
jgi:hypothetical protein